MGHEEVVYLVAVEDLEARLFVEGQQPKNRIVVISLFLLIIVLLNTPIKLPNLINPPRNLLNKQYKLLRMVVR